MIFSIVFLFEIVKLSFKGSHCGWLLLSQFFDIVPDRTESPNKEASSAECIAFQTLLCIAELACELCQDLQVDFHVIIELMKHDVLLESKCTYVVQPLQEGTEDGI
jgi:hypothetical protein